MSAHYFPDGEYQWTVGWDETRATFYADVVELAVGGRRRPAARRVVGGRAGQVPGVAALRVELAGRVNVPNALWPYLIIEELQRVPARSVTSAAEATTAMEWVPVYAKDEDRHLLAVLHLGVGAGEAAARGGDGQVLTVAEMFDLVGGPDTRAGQQIEQTCPAWGFALRELAAERGLGPAPKVLAPGHLDPSPWRRPVRPAGWFGRLLGPRAARPLDAREARGQV